jgi:hypothetical protein
MKNQNRMHEEIAFKPIGAALAAVVAGLGAPAQAEAVELRAPPAPDPTATTREHYVDPTNDPRFEQDETLILGPSEPVEPFGEKPPPAKQADLFDL